MKKQIKAIDYSCSYEAHGYKNVRFVENVSRGLRRVGFADEIARAEYSRTIEHKGWFTDDDGDNGEVYRGVVYQLPTHGGTALYVYGYADPYNDDCALLSFDPELSKLEAARSADHFAERYADKERDYNRAWRAGRRCEEIADEIKATRTEALALGDEMRSAKRANIAAPTICAAIRGNIVLLYRRIQKARRERDELHDTFGTCQGFTE